MESAPPAAPAGTGDERAVRPVPLWRAAAHAVPAILAIGISVYRAATLSVTFDEGTTYLDYVRQGLAAIAKYHPNNHTLSSFFIWIATRLFGTSLFVVRLPSLLATTLFLWTMFRLCSLLWARPIERFVVMCLVSLNPLFLDFFCLARGYSLALALQSVAFLLLVRDLIDHESGTGAARRTIGISIASLALALSCVTNYANAFISIGIGAGYVTASWWFPRSSGAPRLEWWKRILLSVVFAAVGPSIGYALMRKTLPSIIAEKYHTGFPDSPVDTIRDLLNATFFHNETAASSGGEVRESPILIFPDNSRQSWVAHTAAPYLTGLMVPFVIALICVAVWRLGRRYGQREVLAPALWMSGVALAFTWESFEIVHRTSDVRYPLDRVVLYFVWLFIVGASGLALSFRSWIPRSLYLSCASTLLVIVLAHADLRYTRTWRFDAGIKSFLSFIDARHANSPGKKFTIGGSWIYDTAELFYQDTLYSSWLLPYVDGGPAPTLDYFIFHPKDPVRVDTRGFRLVLEDPLSGAQLLERDPSVTLTPLPPAPEKQNFRNPWRAPPRIGPQ